MYIDEASREWTVASTTSFEFSSADSNTPGSGDVGINRAGAAIMKVNNGSTGSGSLETNALLVPLVADAVMPFGSIVMADAGTDDRFDANATNGTLAIGVLTGTGPSAQGTEYNVAVTGRAYVVPITGLTITRGEVVYQSATAGYGQNNAALQAAGKNVGISLYSEAMYTAATATVDLDLNTFKLSSAPGWAVGDPAVYYNGGGASATGLTTGNVYWVATIASDVISVAGTKGGTTIDISGTGNNAQFFQRLPLCMINIR